MSFCRESCEDGTTLSMNTSKRLIVTGAHVGLPAFSLALELEQLPHAGQS